MAPTRLRTTFGGEERFRAQGPMLGGAHRGIAASVEGVDRAKSPRLEFVLAGGSAPRTGVRASVRYANAAMAPADEPSEAVRARARSAGRTRLGRLAGPASAGAGRAAGPQLAVVDAR